MRAEPETRKRAEVAAFPDYFYCPLHVPATGSVPSFSSGGPCKESFRFTVIELFFLVSFTHVFGGLARFRKLNHAAQSTPSANSEKVTAATHVPQ